MPSMHCTIHHGSPRIAPREICCFVACSDLALRLSSLVQDGIATDCLHDATVSTVTSVAEVTVNLHVGPPSAYARPSVH